MSQEDAATASPSQQTTLTLKQQRRQERLRLRDMQALAMSASGMMLITDLPSALLTKVLQFVPLLSRLRRCTPVCRSFAGHVRHPMAFASDLASVPVKQWRALDSATQLAPIVTRCSTFSALSQQVRLDSACWSGHDTVKVLLSFAHHLPYPPCSSLTTPSSSPLRFLFLSGDNVDTFFDSLATITSHGNVRAHPLASVQVVNISSASPCYRRREPLSEMFKLLASLQSLEVLYLGHYTLEPTQVAQLLALRLRRLDLSTCCCPSSIKTRDLILSPRLETLLLPDLEAWKSSAKRDLGGKADPFLPLTRDLMSVIKSQAVTSLRHLRVSGVFKHRTLAEVTSFRALCSLDLTIHGLSDWTLAAELYGSEEDGQTYMRLPHLRHFRLNVELRKDRKSALAPECEIFTQTMRTFLTTYAEQLETLDMPVTPTQVGECLRVDHCLLPSLPRLRRLALHGLHVDDLAHRHNRGLLQPKAQLPMLHTLVLTKMEVGDAAVMAILAVAPLQHVTLDSCLHLTTVTLLALATSCPSLLSIFLLHCNRLLLTSAAFQAANEQQPTLFLPATSDTQPSHPKLNRGCSLSPQAVFASLHTFVYQFAQRGDAVDEAGLTTLRALFNYAPLQYLSVQWNETAQAVRSTLRQPFDSIATLRSFAVQSNHPYSKLQQRFTQTRVQAGCAGRVGAVQALVLCDESRYGAQAMSVAELESSTQHWQHFEHVFRSDKSRKEFWAAIEACRLPPPAVPDA